MQTQATKKIDYNKLMIEQALQETRENLGLVPSELQDVRRRMNKELKHESNDRGAVTNWLKWYQDQAEYEELTATTLIEARKYLGFDRVEMAKICGFKNMTEKSLYHTIYRMEKGMREIHPALNRLVRSFLTGFRPHYWPEKPSD